MTGEPPVVTWKLLEAVGQDTDIECLGARRVFKCLYSRLMGEATEVH